MTKGKTKKSKRTNPVAIEKYEQAFRVFIKDDTEIFEIKEYWVDGPMIAKYKDQVYRVDSENDMYNYVKNLLIDVESAVHIPVSYWIKVAEDVHLVPYFIEKLIEELTSEEEIKHLNYALNISNHASCSASVFWNLIYQLDDFQLYPKAIVAASKTYDLECLINELLTYLTSDGIDIFNELSDGIFEEIDTDPNDEWDIKEDQFFYIYSVDPMCWE